MSQAMKLSPFLPVALVIGGVFLFSVAFEKRGLDAESRHGGSDSMKPTNLAQSNRDQKDPNAPKTIFYAAAAGNLSAVEEMIRRGADTNERDRYGKTALVYAVTNGKDDLAIVLSLLAAGADVNARNQIDGSTPLLKAIDPGGTDAEIRALLDRGADVNSADNNGWTPLMVASDWGHTPLIELLLNTGANLNAKKTDGKTALMVAAEGGKSEAVKVLLKNGADLGAKDNLGKTALMLAEEYYRRNEKIVNPSVKRHMIRIIGLLKRNT